MLFDTLLFCLCFRGVFFHQPAMEGNDVVEATQEADVRASQTKEQERVGALALVKRTTSMGQSKPPEKPRRCDKCCTSKTVHTNFCDKMEGHPFT